MSKDDIKALKNVLSLFDQVKFNDISLAQQMTNVRILNAFSDTVVRLEKSLSEDMKVIEEKTGIKDAESK